MQKTLSRAARAACATGGAVYPLELTKKRHPIWGRVPQCSAIIGLPIKAVVDFSGAGNRVVNKGWEIVIYSFQISIHTYNLVSSIFDNNATIDQDVYGINKVCLTLSLSMDFNVDVKVVNHRKRWE